MLTHIDVDSENSFFVPILGVTPKESLLIRKITGLSPPDINLFIGDYSRDGGTYQGRRVGKRNVVITFDLNPNPALGETISGLREMLYQAFVDPYVDADYIKLTLHDDNDRALYLVGYTEKFETEIFDIETMAQISIICPDPYLRDEVSTSKADPNGWISLPFDYPGTAETGFEVQIHISSTTSKVTLDNNGKKMVLIDSVTPFNTSDVIYINTKHGERTILKANTANVKVATIWNNATAYTAGAIVSYNNQVWKALVNNTNVPPVSGATWEVSTLSSRWTALRAASQTTPLIAKLTPESPWLELHSQNNIAKLYGATTADLVANAKELNYTAAYWGV